MSESKLYIVAKLDEQSQRALARIYTALYDAGLRGRQTEMPYHITLGSFPKDHEAELVAKMEEVSVETRQLPVTMEHLGLFGLDVLFAAPVYTHELLALREAFDTSEHWAAHATLLIDDHENIGRAIPLAARAFRPFGGYIDSLMLIEFPPLRYVHECSLHN